MGDPMSFYDDILELILTKQIQTKEELHREKINLCKKYKIDTIPRDSEILAHLPVDFTEEETTYTLLRKKSTRTISGVTIVAVMTSPASCPHGRCIPCPGGPEQDTPQSYTGHEPAALRAISNNFDPYLQTTSRLAQLKAIGHSIDKIDFIVMGGTFTSRHPEYQEWFIKRCYDGLNAKNSQTLLQAKRINEHAKSHCIGLTVETRPDWFRLQHADLSLNLGATRVEFGVQTINDEVLHMICRGHTVEDTFYATRIAKEAGFKVCYHMMPGLPGSDKKKDLAAFKMLFTDDRLKPDMIKIYPTLIIKGTKLYDQWKAGDFKPLTTEQATVLIAQMKNNIPPWVRVQRIQRDIPASKIAAGVMKSNLRQLVENEMNSHGTACRCIRCREIGLQSLKKKIDVDTLGLSIIRHEYTANDGHEIFLSLEDPTCDLVIGYLRLRDIIHPHRWELMREPCMLIRELKILGRELSIGVRSPEGFQHRGYGKQLIIEAERICIEDFNKKQLFVLSGIGVKPYYRKLGFSDSGVYLKRRVHS
jgi:elongator complex protein 3